MASLDESAGDPATPPVPSRPHMPPRVVALLEARIKEATCFLEYGSGGSTVLEGVGRSAQRARAGNRHFLFHRAWSSRAASALSDGQAERLTMEFSCSASRNVLKEGFQGW